MKPALPCGECKGKCCTYPPMSRREFKRIRKKYGVPKGAVIEDMGHLIMPLQPDSDRCAYLIDGRCSVYDLRPKTCRDYGEVPQMPCCYLYPEEANEAAVKMVQGFGLRVGSAGPGLHRPIQASACPRDPILS